MRPLADLSLAERLNFLLCNRIPRRLATLLMARISRSEKPWVMHPCMAAWQWFADDLRLDEAAKQEFNSLHDCFIRELKPGSRPFDATPGGLASPCDAVVGEFGRIEGLAALQAKGMPYTLAELLGDEQQAAQHASGRFLTLRLKSSMYHRFHAPCTGHVSQVRYISGDTWNVNPVALKVVERLFCRNERAVIPLQLPAQGTGHSNSEPEVITIVAVAAILVACIRLHGLPQPLQLRYRGPNLFHCSLEFNRGQEMGWFEHGSTLVLLLPASYAFEPDLQPGQVIRAGQRIMHRIAGCQTENSE